MLNRKESRVFVTGASGFIGANLVRLLLKKNYDVHIINRKKNLPWRLQDLSQLLHVHVADLTNFDSINKALKKAKPDYIIHLASYGAYHYQTELSKIVTVNIEGTKNLLEASKEIPYKCFINTGSSSEYGFKNKPMKENDFCDPVSYYAATKLAQTHICKVFAQVHNKPIITLRLFSIYGPYEEPTRFIPTIMKSLIKNTSIKLTPGKQRRDFVYIEDITKAYIKALKLKVIKPGDIFNLGSGKENTNDEIVEKLFHVTKKKTSVEKGAYAKRTWDTIHWVADISKTDRILKWQPHYSLDKGLLDTYSWFKKNLHLYQ